MRPTIRPKVAEQEEHCSVVNWLLPCGKPVKISFALVKDLSSILDISAELDQDLQTRQYIMDLGAVPILGRPIRDTLIC